MLTTINKVLLLSALLSSAAIASAQTDPLKVNFVFSVQDGTFKPIAAASYDIGLGGYHKTQTPVLAFSFLGGLGTQTNSDNTTGGIGAGFRFFAGPKASIFVGQWFDQLQTHNNHWAFGFSFN